MASTSSSTSNSQYCRRWKYHVFLSFRGEDTRRNFTSHLYEVLNNRGIVTFQDDKRLEYGDSISEELLTAIQESQVAIVVFSEHYATSSWCLNELVKIMECKNKNGQTVIPIFYDVDPSHVRKQTESFAVAFAEHEKKCKDDYEGMQKVKGWRTAVTEGAKLSGCDIRNRIESECIRDLADQISKLCKTSLSYLKDIVGINTQLEKVKSLLQMEINNVRIVGIWGMGGVGKTTIARAIFDTLTYQFEAASFLADIKENEKKNQLHSLQNTLLSELLRGKAYHVNNKYEGRCMISSRLCTMKVLIVLDDIDDREHLEYLADDVGWFGNGSRVVVTTRNKDLIKNAAATYEVKPLPDHEATQLFDQYAFKQNNGVPSDEFFKNLSLEVVNHAKGLPLALKLWGSLLHKRGIDEWRRTIEKIKKKSSSEIVEKLKISYDGLEVEEQTIFLDMACFFRGKGKKLVMEILESCDFEAEYGLNILIEKSLVFLSKNDRIEMHDLIQDMGKYIVKMQKDPGERSRLWDVEDINEVMVDNTGTKTVEAIWSSYITDICFSKEATKNMKMLRILYIRTYCDYTFDDGLIEYLPNKLRWIVWEFYPWKSLPAKFEPKKLVHLEIRQSKLCQLWKETKHLPSLRTLNLYGSKNLMRTPDFKGMPNLEYLNLMGCESLEEVDCSLGDCPKLTNLDLSLCIRLKRFPCINVESLEYLNLVNCQSLEIFPEIIGRSKLGLKIIMDDSGIRELSSSFFQYQTHITKLDLSHMTNLAALPSSIGVLKSLVELDVSNCSKLESLPEEIGDLENLERLQAQNTLISRPPSSIVRLNKLKFLSFEKEIEMECSLKDGVYFVFPPVAEGLRSLEFLNLNYCNLEEGGLPEDIGCLSSLKTLFLSGNNFEHLPQSITQLGALLYMHLLDCKRLKELPEFPQQLDTISADWSNDWICNSLFQNISSWQCNISASDSLSLRVFTTWKKNIPSWFHHRGTGRSVSVNLSENWYIRDNFLGFAVCYSGSLIETTAKLLPLCDDGITWMSQKLALSNHSKYALHFFLVPLAILWDTSKANGKTPNDYGLIRLFFSGDVWEYGFRLLYKEEPELEALLQMTENNAEPTEHCIGIRRSRYENIHESVSNEASCSSSKKQRSLQQQEEAPVSSEILQLFPTSPVI